MASRLILEQLKLVHRIRACQIHMAAARTIGNLHPVTTGLRAPQITSRRSKCQGQTGSSNRRKQRRAITKTRASHKTRKAHSLSLYAARKTASCLDFPTPPSSRRISSQRWTSHGGRQEGSMHAHWVTRRFDTSTASGVRADLCGIQLLKSAAYQM